MKRLYTVVFFLLFLITSIYLSLYYNLWFAGNCVDVIGADTKLHFADAFMFMKNFDNYGLWYPVNFFYSTLGSYWVDHPLALPGQFIFLIPFSQFMSFSKAFYLGYLLFFVLLILAIYMFFSRITNELYAVLISFSLLVLPYLNKPFSVGGNYPFFVSLPFFFFALTFFYDYCKDKKKESAFWFTLAAIGVGYTYLFSLFFLLSFVVVYSVLKKNYNIILLSLLILLTTSVFNLPIFLSYDPTLYGGGHAGDVATLSEKFADLVKVFTPSHPFAWIYSTIKENIDTNHGFGIVLLFLIAVLYFFLLKRENIFKDEKFIFLLLLWGVVLIWVLLLTIFTYFSTFDPSERVITLFVVVSFLIGAYVLYEVRINLYSLVLFALVFVISLVVNQPIYFGAGMFVIIFVAVIYYTFKDSSYKFLANNKYYQHILLSFIILFLLFFPMTGMTESSTLYPRSNIFIQDVFSKYINENDTFLFLGLYPSEYSIFVCSNAKTIYSHRHFSRDKQEKIISGIRNEFLNGNYNPLFAAIEKYKVTKLIFDPILFNDNNNFQKEKAQPISNKYGIPKLIEGKVVSIGKLYTLPYLIFNVQKKAELYRIETVNPTKLIVHKDTALDNFEILLSYNKKWKTSAEELSESEDGLVFLKNVGGKSEIILTYDTTLYIVGLVITLLSILGIVVFFRKKF